MGTGNAEATTMREAIGMDLKEIIALREAAWGSLSSPMLELSRRNLHEASPAVYEAIRNALIAPWFSAFSEAGQAITVSLARDQPEALATWDNVLSTVLADPVNLRDVAIWCLFFAAGRCGLRRTVWAAAQAIAAAAPERRRSSRRSRPRTPRPAARHPSGRPRGA